MIHRLPLLVVLLAVGVLGACARPPVRATGPWPLPPPPIQQPAAAAEVPEPSEPPLSGEVLVRDDAWLHAAPGDAVRFRVKGGDGPLADHEAHRFEVLADRGEWVQLAPGQTSGWPPRTCAYPLFELSELAVALWVKRDALVPVTTRTVTERFADGTYLVILPGSPVGSERQSDGWRLMSSDDVSFFAPVPEAAVGYSFRGWAPPRKEPPPLTQRVRAAARLSFAGTELLRSGSVDGRVAKIEVGEEDAMLWLELDCVRAAVRTSSFNVTERKEGEGGGLSDLLGALADGGWFFVPAKTAVYWPDGRTAGVQRRGINTSSGRFTTQGDLRCFTSVLGEQGPRAERTVTLCYRAADLQKVDGPFPNLAPGAK